MKRLFFKNLPVSYTAKELHEVIMQEAEVPAEKVFLLMNRETEVKNGATITLKKPSGRAIVTVRDEFAEKIKMAMHAREIEDSVGGVKRLSVTDAIDDPVKLYIGNLPWDVKSTDWLKKYFKDNCNVVIEDLAIIFDRENEDRSRGFAFAKLTRSDANKILVNKSLEIDGRLLRINIAENRRDKEKEAITENREE